MSLHLSSMIKVTIAGLAGALFLLFSDGARPQWTDTPFNEIHNEARAATAGVADVAPAHGPTQHDHDMQNMAASAPSPSATSGQAPPAPLATASITDGDAAAGRVVFRKCQACHSLEPGKHLLGPSLAGIIGRKAGSEAGYNYSSAMTQSGIVWDAKTLDAYLADPKTIPGNKMPFPGLKTDHDRKDVVAFLASVGGSTQTSPAAPSLAQQTPPAAPSASTQQTPAPTNQAPPSAGAGVSYIPDAKYTLRSGIAEGRMVYLGVGGEIEGKVNPVLTAAEGQAVQLTLINGEGAEHDIVFPDINWPVCRVNSSLRSARPRKRSRRRTSRANRPICRRPSSSASRRRSA